MMLKQYIASQVKKHLPNLDLNSKEGLHEQVKIVRQSIDHYMGTLGDDDVYQYISFDIANLDVQKKEETLKKLRAVNNQKDCIASYSIQRGKLSGVAIIETESVNFLKSHLKEIKGLNFKDVNDSEISLIMENKVSKQEQFIY